MDDAQMSFDLAPRAMLFVLFGGFRLPAEGVGIGTGERNLDS